MNGTRVQARRVRPVEIVGGQVQHTLVALVRSQIVLVFTFAMPLVWLLLIGLLAGNDTVGPGGLRVMQFASPTAIAMGTFFATMPPVAISIAESRERGVLKRLRGTPLPAWGYVVGQVAAAAIFAIASLVVTLTVSVVLYGVQLRPETLAATAVTILLGVLAFTAIGLAIGSLSHTAATAEALSIGSAVVLSFISGLFLIGGSLPAWLETIATVFPLRPYASLLQHQFDPSVEGNGFDLAALGTIAAWGAVAAIVGLRAFRWERHRPAGLTVAPRSRVARRSAARTAAAADGTLGTGGLTVVVAGRPSVASRVIHQSASAVLGAWRRPGDMFFSIIMPVGLFVLLITVQGAATTLPGGTPLVVSLAASMITWGAGVTVFLNLPEQVARARETGVLKRVRGTPLTAGQYLAGRTAAGVIVAVIVAGVIVALGAALYDLRLRPGSLLLGFGIVVLGSLSLAACGFLLVALVPTARAVGAVGLAVLFTLSFFSDVFITVGPAWMSTVGSAFPLKHLQNGLVAAWDPAGPTVPWTSVLVLAAWGAGAAALAVWRFRWQPSGS